MRWYHYASYFVAGAFWINATPHLTNGLSGRPFPTPFASPPGEGESSALLNVVWGGLNVLAAYLLTCRVGQFQIRETQHVLVMSLGGLLMALLLARTFGRVYGGV